MITEASNSFWIDFVLCNISTSRSIGVVEELCVFDRTFSLSSVSRTNIKINRHWGKAWGSVLPAPCLMPLWALPVWESGPGLPAGDWNSEGRRGAEEDERWISTRRRSTLKRNSMQAPVDICFHRCAHPVWLRLALHTPPKQCCADTTALWGPGPGPGRETSGTVALFQGGWNWWWVFELKTTGVERRKWWDESE